MEYFILIVLILNLLGTIAIASLMIKLLKYLADNEEMPIIEPTRRDLVHTNMVNYAQQPPLDAEGSDIVNWDGIPRGRNWDGIPQIKP